jgi:hypothetical protein
MAAKVMLEPAQVQEGLDQVQQQLPGLARVVLAGVKVVRVALARMTTVSIHRMDQAAAVVVVLAAALAALAAPMVLAPGALLAAVLPVHQALAFLLLPMYQPGNQ